MSHVAISCLKKKAGLNYLVCCLNFFSFIFILLPWSTRQKKVILSDLIYFDSSQLSSTCFLLKFSFFCFNGFLCVVSIYSREYSFYIPSNSNICYFHLNDGITQDLIRRSFLCNPLSIFNSVSPAIKLVFQISQVLKNT